MLRIKQSALRAWQAQIEAEGLDTDIPLRRRKRRSREQMRQDLQAARAKAKTPLARRVLTRALERFDQSTPPTS